MEEPSEEREPGGDEQSDKVPLEGEGGEERGDGGWRRRMKSIGEGRL